MARGARSETEFDLLDSLPGALAPPSDARLPSAFGGRYQVQAWLGRGGMASVYRAVDRSTGSALAIKHSLHSPQTQKGRELCALFEREFHLLAQLSHPHVIEVYDYGVDDGRPYYTMELLDGGDLDELSPLPWRRVCALTYDVCSSLALLHSRRFVHRDISPRNVRCTRAGFAKLIDFGAAVPMGVAQHVVGTPAFVAPEALSRSALDARADLFALGATCYFALTGRPPFQAQHLSDLSVAWSLSPYRPSQLVDDVPAALDELVMSLLCLEPEQRPRSAFEVMQRVSAIADLSHDEAHAVPQAYLSAPVTVGRDSELARLRERIALAVIDRRSEPRPLPTLLTAPSGAGRTHLLDAAALIGKMLGATVLHAGANARSPGFDVGQTLLTQLLECAPSVALAAAQRESVSQLLFQVEADPAGIARPRLLHDAGDAAAVRAALTRLLFRVAGSCPLLVIVDDVHNIDEDSLSLVTELAQSSQQHHMSLLMASDDAPALTRGALGVLARYCEPLSLVPLDQAATLQLVTSLFGDVPNVVFVSHELYQRAHGNPGATLWSARWLVQRGAIRYEAGAWTLPAQLSAAELPLSHEQVIIEQLGRLSPLARQLVECQSLAVHGVFSRDDYMRLAPEQPAPEVERALLELVSAGVLNSDGHMYQLSQPGYARLLSSGEREREREGQHRALARLYLEPGVPLVYAVPHLLSSGQEQAAIDRLLEHFGHEDTQVGDLAADYRLSLGPEALAHIYAQCLACAERRGVPLRTLCELRRRLVLVSVVEDEKCYRLAAPSWRAQLERDSGLTRYRELDPGLPALERLQRAYGEAQTAFEHTAVELRAYAPDEAIRLLVQYVVTSIVVASRSLDTALVLSLPDLLEPFEPLSPVLLAIRHNALGMCDYIRLRHIQTRARWQSVYEQLERITGTELRYVAAIRNAIAFGLSTIDLTVGQLDVEAWLRTLDQDPMQRVHAMYLRKLAALQQGDWEAAERFRKRAELLAVHDRTQQMFTTLLWVELATHTLAGDLSGLKYVTERIETVAERQSKWRPLAQLARANFQFLCGNVQQAREGIEACLDACDPRRVGEDAVLQAFCPGAAAYVEVLDALAEHDLAIDWGRAALSHMRSLEVDVASWELERVLAVAESKHLDRIGGANQRLAGLLAAQRAAGVSGLRLGATYEAFARVAIQAHDVSSVVRYAQLAAAEYRHGLGSLLSARYERLRDEARRAGIELV